MEDKQAEYDYVATLPDGFSYCTLGSQAAEISWRSTVTRNMDGVLLHFYIV